LLQWLWARVLEGEIRKPKSFSLKTLRFVSELDAYTAQTFEKYVDFVFGADFIPTQTIREGEGLTELYHLQDVGLVTGVGGTLAKIFRFDANPFPPADTSPAMGAWFSSYCERLLVFKAPLGARINVTSVLLTTTGKEMLAILNRKFDLEKLRRAIDLIPKELFRSIEVGQPIVSGHQGAMVFESLWQQPT
jgi:Protein of unknown function (DUF2806)